MSVWFVYDHGDELGKVKVGGANRYLAEAVERYVAERVAPVEVAPAPAPAGAATPPAVPAVEIATRRGTKPRRVRLLDPREIKRGAA